MAPRSVSLPVIVAQDQAGHGRLAGDLAVPGQAGGVVLFAHGSGSSRHSPRNRAVARALRERGFGTLLLDLLTEDEERVDLRTRALRFDIGLLAERLVHAIDWLGAEAETRALPVGLFGASTGAAAALVAAAQRPEAVRAVVSRGRPARSGRARAGPGSGPDAADRGRQRPACARPEPGGRRALLRADTASTSSPRPRTCSRSRAPWRQVAGLAAGWFADHLAGTPAGRTPRP